MTVDTKFTFLPFSSRITYGDDEGIREKLSQITRTSGITCGNEGIRKKLSQLTMKIVDNYDNDTVLIAVAVELGGCVPYVEGVDYAGALLPPLESLCTHTDPFVRDKAVESLCRIGAQMKEQDLVDLFAPLVKRLAAGKSFTDRDSSCGLFHVVYPSAPEYLKKELRSLYSKLCRDDVLLVRTNAVSNLEKFVATVGPSDFKSDIMSVFEYLARDDDDSVRILAINSIMALGKILEPQVCVAHLLPVIFQFCQDKFWRVRQTVANHLCELIEATRVETKRCAEVSAYLRLLQDEKAEVRTAAARNVTKICRICYPTYAKQTIILPYVEILSRDPSSSVRLALASVVTGMAQILGKDETVARLLPIILFMLKDKFPGVRRSLISNLDEVNEVIGVEHLHQSLFAPIVELANDSNWEVSVEKIKYITLSAIQLGVRSFDDKLGALYMHWLKDQMSFVCFAAVDSLKRLAEAFGSEWAMHYIVPQLLDTITDQDYLHSSGYKAATLELIGLLAPILGPEITCSKLLPAVRIPLKHGRASIKRHAAEVFQSINRAVDPCVEKQKIHAGLAELSV